jgi:hypothetical protein
VDESSLTGESIPVPKSLGDKLFTGTTNITSVVTVRVTKLGNLTALQQIVRAVGESLNHKAPIEELADRITAVFVPIVVYLSLIVLTVWLAISLIPELFPSIGYLMTIHNQQTASSSHFGLPSLCLPLPAHAVSVSLRPLLRPLVLAWRRRPVFSLKVAVVRSSWQHKWTL